MFNLHISQIMCPYCFSLPLQIGVALYLLYTQVKFAFVSGLTITILLIPGTIITIYIDKNIFKIN